MPKLNTIVKTPCTECKGTGKKTKGICQTCQGNKVVTHMIYVKK